MLVTFFIYFFKIMKFMIYEFDSKPQRLIDLEALVFL